MTTQRCGPRRRDRQTGSWRGGHRVQIRRGPLATPWRPCVRSPARAQATSAATPEARPRAPRPRRGRRTPRRHSRASLGPSRRPQVWWPLVRPAHRPRTTRSRRMPAAGRTVRRRRDSPDRRSTARRRPALRGTRARRRLRRRARARAAPGEGCPSSGPACRPPARTSWRERRLWDGRAGRRDPRAAAGWISRRNPARQLRGRRDPVRGQHPGGQGALHVAEVPG